MAETVTYTNKRTPLAEFYLTVKGWISFLLSRWLVLLLFFIVGGAIGVWYSYTVKPLYQSKLSFALDEGGSSNMGGAMSIAAQLGINIGGSSSEVFGGDNILEIMKSRKNIEAVLLSVDSSESKPVTLVDKFINIARWDKKFEKTKRLKGIAFPAGQPKKSLSYLQDSALFLIYDRFAKEYISATRPDKRLNIYEVSVTTPDEKFTKVFTDRLVEYTSAFYISIRTKKSRGTLDALENRANATKELLNSSITDKAATQDANINPAFAKAQAPLQKQQVNIQVYGGAYGELYKNLEMARFQYLKEVPLLQVIDEANYPMKKIRFGRLRGLAYGAVIGFFAGMVLVVIIQFLKSMKGIEMESRK